MRMLKTAVLIGILMSSTASAQDVDKDLATAARSGEGSKVAALLKAGANVNGRTSDRKTPLMWAACYGHLKIVEALLAAGADIEATDSLGGTAILYATAGVHDDVVALLKAKGAKPPALDGIKLFTWVMGQPSGPGDVYDYLAERGKLKKKP